MDLAKKVNNAVKRKKINDLLTLANEDLKRVNWDPESIDLADYWVNIHTKGIEKWIRPMFSAPRKTG